MSSNNPVDFWNERYSAEEYAYGTAPNDFLAEVANRIPPGRVLCLAEGEGRNAVFLAEKGYQVVGVDASPVGLEKARRLAASRGVEVETIVADLANFDIAPDSWSGIVSIWAHLPPPVRKRLHRQAVDGLVEGGAFVLEAYTPAQLAFGTGGPPVAELMMDLKSLREELAGLDFVIAREMERDVREGMFHGGRSAVVQILAFKQSHTN
jgi:SAM-dependent methyltransferase